MFYAYFSFNMLLTKEAIATVFCDNDKYNFIKLIKTTKNSKTCVRLHDNLSQNDKKMMKLQGKLIT